MSCTYNYKLMRQLSLVLVARKVHIIPILQVGIYIDIKDSDYPHLGMLAYIYLQHTNAEAIICWHLQDGWYGQNACSHLYTPNPFISYQRLQYFNACPI